MRPAIQAFFDPATFTASFLVWDPESRDAAIIDPVLDFEPRNGRLSTRSADAILAAAEAEGLRLRYILETHVHADHLTAADYLRGRTQGEIGIGRRITEVQATFGPVFEIAADDCGPEAFDRLLTEDDALPLGQGMIRVLDTPGHTPADVTYLIGDAAFVGDTLFMPDYGTARTDFPGGDAQTLYRSIRKILALPDQTRIFVGHDYLPPGRASHAWETTVAEQRARNIHIHDGVTEAAFVALRQARDTTLAPPVLLLPSLQVNIRAGALPPASPAGHVFLKIPVGLPS